MATFSECADAGHDLNSEGGMLMGGSVVDAEEVRAPRAALVSLILMGVTTTNLAC